MSRMRIAGTVLLLGALGAACADQPAQPQQSPATGPSFSFSNNPDNGNPRIARFGEVAGYLLVDPATNLFSLQASTNRQFGCNTQPELFTLQDVQNILHNPDDPLAGQINEIRLGKGVYIAVYEGFDGWEASGFDCADLFSRKLAEGVGNFVNTDNDVFVFLREHNNHDAFGFVAQGRLARLSGGTAAYNGVSKCVWDGVTDVSLRCQDKINF